MSKIDKKLKKVREAIEVKETRIRTALAKKDSATREIDLPKEMRELADLKEQLADLLGQQAKAA